jgi:hypothetical protein
VIINVINDDKTEVKSNSGPTVVSFLSLVANSACVREAC